MSGHIVIMSKMKKAGPFLAHPVLARHVPETVWYEPGNLIKMLAKYGTIYLKPDTGCQGRGIIRLTGKGEECELSHGETVNIVRTEKLSPVLKSMMDARRKYIIQQGIELATRDNCPFDIRIVMQKPYSTWQLTLTSAKVALRPDAVVTNVARGARDYPLLDIIMNYDQKLEPLFTYRELLDLAHQGASLLGSAFPFRIIGFDMAVDKAGRIWFIEANVIPQCEQCKLVNDSLSVQKYEDAKAVIGRIGRRHERRSR